MITDIIALSGLINGIGALIIMLFGFFRRKSFVHKIFALVNLALLIWSFAYWRWLLADTHDLALFWVRIFSIGSTLIPIFFLHWMLVLIGKKKKILLILGYLMTVVFLAFNFSSLFIADVEPTFSYAFHPKPGILYHFYIVFSYIFLMGYGIYSLFKRYRKSSGYKKAQLKYVFLGIVIAVIAGLGNFPNWYNINIPAYTNFLVIVYIACCAYSMTKYRFMDIRIMLARSLVYFISLILAIGLSLLVFYLLPLPFVIVLLLSVLLSFLVFWLMDRLGRAWARYFYPNFLKTKQVLSSLEEKLVHLLDLDTFSEIINDSLKQAFLLNRIGIVISNKIQVKEGFDDSILEISKQLTPLLIKYKKPLGAQEIIYFKDYLDIRDQFQRMDIELAIPLVFEKQVIGVIFLGKKSSKDTYSKEEIMLLNRFSRQASIALKNTLFFTEERKRKEELERFYNLTIGREMKMQELKIRIKALEQKTKELEDKGPK